MQYSDQTDHDNKLNYRQQSNLDMSRNEQEMQVILRGEGTSSITSKLTGEGDDAAVKKYTLPISLIISDF